MLNIKRPRMSAVYPAILKMLAMLAAKRSAGVAPEVNLRKRVTSMPLESANKAEPTPALIPTGDLTGSPKQG